MILSWESLERGYRLPAQGHVCSFLDVLKYLGAVGDYNPLHFDGALGGGAGECRVVPGRFKQALLGRLVADWLGHRGFVRQLSCRFLAVDPIGSTLTCRGEVRRRYLEGGRRLVDLRLWVEGASGDKTTVGGAVVEWTASADDFLVGGQVEP